MRLKLVVLVVLVERVGRGRSVVLQIGFLMVGLNVVKMRMV
jgi:hypothetical protein